MNTSAETPAGPTPPPYWTPPRPFHAAAPAPRGSGSGSAGAQVPRVGGRRGARPRRSDGRSHRPRVPADQVQRVAIGHERRMVDRLGQRQPSAQLSPTGS